MLTNSYESKVVGKNFGLLSGSQANYCAELSPDEFISEVRFKGAEEVCLVIVSSTYQQVNKKQLKTYFNGFIASKDHYYRIGYGTKNRHLLDYIKGFNFHKQAPEDPQQKLIF